MNTVNAGQRVKYKIANRHAAEGFEYGYAVVVTGKPRAMLFDDIGRDGDGIPEPHVRAIPEGDSAAYWFPMANLEALPDAGCFYVTARSGERWAALLGPFDSESEARAQVDRGSALACAADQWAHFYSFGTAKITGAVRPMFGR